MPINAFLNRCLLIVLGMLVLGGCERLLPPGADDPTDDVTPVHVAEANEAAVADSVRALYREDAARMALRYLNSRHEEGYPEVRLPEPLVRSLYRALLHVYNARELAARDSVTQHYSIHTFPRRPTVHWLIVGVTSSADWANAWKQGQRLTGNSRVDSLMQHYDLSLSFFDEKAHPHAGLRSNEPLNMKALAQRFAPISGVRYAEPSGWAGDGNDIAARAGEDFWQLRYSVGFGDCPAGCTHRHYWTFRVYESGRVEYVGNGGDPLAWKQP